MINIIVFSVLILLTSLKYEVAARAPLQVVNGTDAEVGEFPYMVQLRSEDEIVQCGGSIIGPEWILTAAHCIDFTGIDHIVYGFNKETKTNKTIAVKKSFTNPKFTHKNDVPFYDLALLQLSKPIPLGSDVKTIKLVEPNGNVPFHVETKYGGWGWAGYFNASRVPLQKITTQIFTDDECRNVYNKASGEDIMDTDNNLCTENYLSGVCYGDSGSPLVVNGVQYGITSWVYEPCEIFPAAFTRISNPEYRKWIKDVSNI